MHARRPFRVKTLLILCVASLLLGACGGGSTGSTWFNLPSVTLRVGDDGDSIRTFGLNVGSLSAFGIKDIMDSLAASGTDTLEVRIGYNGIHVYANGQDLPYIHWDEDSAAALADVLNAVALQSGTAGADAHDLVNLLRFIGVGVRIQLTDSPAERWRGETSFTPENAPEEIVGPLDLSGVAFDGAGNMTLDGVDLGMLGLPPLLDAATLQMLSSLGAETLSVQVTPNTLDLALNGNALPSLAYDTESLAAGLELARALLADDPDTLGLVETLLPSLPAMDLTVQVSFTGEAVGGTTLGALHVDVSEAGELSVLGLPLGADLLPAATLAPLTDAGVHRLDLQINGSEIALAQNGQVMPTITLHENGRGLIAQIAGDPNVPNILALLDSLTASAPLELVLTLPGDTSDPAAASPLADLSFAPAELGELNRPVLRLPVTVDGGQLTSIGGLDPSALGMSDPIMLPLGPLADAGIDSLTVKTTTNRMDIMTDGQDALSLAYDEMALQGLLGLVSAMTGGPLGGNAAMETFIMDVLLEMVVVADAELTLDMP